MEFVTRPEPNPEEREAVALALDRLFAADGLPPAYASRWRAAGIAENLDREGESAREPRSALLRRAPIVS